MPVRPTMQTNIIPAIRDLINDPNPPATQFSDQQVQDAADESRFDIRYELLAAAPTITNDGTGGGAVYVWIDYFSQFQYWEVGEAVTQKGDFQQVNAVATEFINGHWQFNYNIAAGTLPPNSDAPAQYPPVFVTGRAYDIYASAVVLLKKLKAKYILTAYNFSADGQSFSRHQIIENIDSLLADYSRKIIWRDAAMVRDDASVMHHASQPVHLYGLNDRLP